MTGELASVEAAGAAVEAVGFTWSELGGAVVELAAGVADGAVDGALCAHKERPDSAKIAAMSGIEAFFIHSPRIAWPQS
ncbi:MAG: hypothetical protein M0Z80_01160 [Treponema sp.]|nr:hypothetical protein [Treponema sp.]